LSATKDGGRYETPGEICHLSNAAKFPGRVRRSFFEVELFFKNKRKDFLIHRLDREAFGEAFGIVVVAHDKNAAAGLSRLFQSRQIIKRYRARVLGDLTQKNLIIQFNSRWTATLRSPNMKRFTMIHHQTPPWWT